MKKGNDNYGAELNFLADVKIFGIMNMELTRTATTWGANYLTG